MRNDDIYPGVQREVSTQTAASTSPGCHSDRRLPPRPTTKSKVGSNGEEPSKALK